MSRRGCGDHEPVDAQSHRHQVDAEPAETDHREQHGPPDQILPRPIPREADRPDPLAIATNEMHDHEGRRQPEDEPEDLVGEERIGVGRRDGHPFHGRGE